MADALPPEAFQFDGLVDSATVAIGAAVAILKSGWRIYSRAPHSFTVFGVDFLNGTVITPFALMVAAVFSATALHYLRSTSPVSTSIAGVIGLIFIANELRK